VLLFAPCQHKRLRLSQQDEFDPPTSDLAQFVYHLAAAISVFVMKQAQMNQVGYKKRGLGIAQVVMVAGLAVNQALDHVEVKT